MDAMPHVRVIFREPVKILLTRSDSFAGTVQMTYFPDNWGTYGNKTYTSYYNTEFGVTM